MGIDRQFKARTRTASLGTVIGITLVLVMLGLQGLVLLCAKTLEQYFKENVRVELFLKRELKEADVMRFRKELDAESFTGSTRYVTADEAAEQLKQDLGEDFLGVLGSNPLLPSVELRLDAGYAQADSMKWIVDHLQKDARVQEVSYHAGVVENMERNFTRLNIGGLVFMALLLLMAIALINNTVRLAIHSKRFLIRTMHLVGATPWFIKRPFLVSGLFQGLVAAMLAIGSLTTLFWVVRVDDPEQRPVDPGLLSQAEDILGRMLVLIDPLTIAMLFGLVLLVGLLIALLSTWSAVGRYLRMDHEMIHWS